MIQYKTALIFVSGLIVGASLTLYAVTARFLFQNKNCRGTVHSIPIPPRADYKLTAHNGKVYSLIEAPMMPEEIADGARRDNKKP